MPPGGCSMRRSHLPIPPSVCEIASTTIVIMAVSNYSKPQRAISILIAAGEAKFQRTSCHFVQSLCLWQHAIERLACAVRQLHVARFATRCCRGQQGYRSLPAPLIASHNGEIQGKVTDATTSDE
eukprot:2188245-Amphidinium_carterae.1